MSIVRHRKAAVDAQREVQTDAVGAAAAYFGRDPEAAMDQYGQVYDATEKAAVAADRVTRGFDIFGRRVNAAQRVAESAQKDIHEIVSVAKKLTKLFR